MHNLYANFVKILEICKDFSKNLVNELGNIPRPGVVPRFSDLEVVALSLTAEHLSIDSENNLFDRLKEYKADMPNLISRRQFNDRRKFTAELCEKIRKRIASKMDGAEEYPQHPDADGIHRGSSQFDMGGLRIFLGFLYRICG